MSNWPWPNSIRFNDIFVFKFEECLISKIKIVKDICFEMDNSDKRGQKIDNLKKKILKIMLNEILIEKYFILQMVHFV